ncbi:MAG: hypothetical protein NT028_08770 [candidate division Zixibacteria bacterium]|nr:hypothetical protein [candidate division Zixibacteria bacterium]
MIDAVHLVRINIGQFDAGDRACYRLIASQLRLLLCDGKGNSLIKRVFPNPRLHPLWQCEEMYEIEKQGGELIFFLPGELASNSSRITNICDRDKEPMELDQWLELKVFDSSITLRGLIRSVADKDGGAHLDDKLDETLMKTYSTEICGERSHVRFLVDISRYLVEEIDIWLGTG